jgi:hypothetical protein
MDFATMARYYRNAALVFLNTVLAIVLINALLYPAITLRYRYFHPDRDNPVMARYLDQSWSAIYPGMSGEDIDIRASFGVPTCNAISTSRCTWTKFTTRLK